MVRFSPGSVANTSPWHSDICTFNQLNCYPILIATSVSKQFTIYIPLQSYVKSSSVVLEDLCCPADDLSCSQSLPQTWVEFSLSLSDISYNFPTWIYNNIFCCCQTHTRILLFHLRAVWLAPGEDGSTCDLLKAPVRVTAVTDRLAWGFWTTNKYICRICIIVTGEQAVSIGTGGSWQTVYSVQDHPLQYDDWGKRTSWLVS
jgi:hypothetical protein